MNRAYALCMLLEHGPLTWGDLAEVTGWPRKPLENALNLSAKRGWVRRLVLPGVHRVVYGLAT